MTSSPKVQKKSKSQPFTVETVSRTPQQGRSKASLQRMLAAARALMVERSSEDFTLIEVSKHGYVSIGSIYLRFESKDNLVRAVIAETMQDMAKAEDRMIAKLASTCPTLADFVPQFVEAYATVLSEYAPLLRLAMVRAEYDPLVAEPGKAAALEAEAKSTLAMLSYEKELGQDDPTMRARAAYFVIFSTLARQLGLGSTRESIGNRDWTMLKRELGRMCLAYLTAN